MIETRLDIPFDPMGAARRASVLSGMAFLHSGLRAYGLGRYSILAACPYKKFDYANGMARIWESDSVREIEGDAFSLLRDECSTGEVSRFPFAGGPLGYFAYDLGKSLEPKALSNLPVVGHEARFHFYGGAAIFDWESRETWWVSRGEEGEAAFASLSPCLYGLDDPEREAFALKSELRSNFSRDAFETAVRRVREYIRDGEVYQVNLSQRFEADYAGASFDLFERLAKASPAPYAAYLDFGDEQLVSSSPERLLQVRDGWATTRPIKGTRPAGGTEEERRQFSEELALSEKDRSELLMIVDLERNDLGKVCRPGSVRVDDLFRLERYATVLHQTADVSGTLAEGVDAMAAVRALFPGGSITGAPKIRAMQVIGELEGAGRGPYTGAIGYFDEGGGADFNIAIRSLWLRDGRVSFQVGGGIVWDSDPESEYEETLLKAQAMMRALGVSDD